MFDKNQPAYIALRDIVAEGTKPIIAWIGAGLSAPAGLPLWRDLKNHLCSAFEAKTRALDGEERQRAEAQLTIAKTEKNFWIAFQILREAIGPTSYRETIRSSLRHGETAAIPPLYESLWKMRLAGVLNLNLDRLASRSYSLGKPGKTLHDFSGKYAANYLHVLRSSHPFVAYLHGVVDDESSWVLTNDDLRQLFAVAGYHDLISSLITTSTILFLGISADDVAAGGHLARLKDQKIDFGCHYWITDRAEVDADRWAENVGLRIIRYNNADRKHAELAQLVEDFTNFVPPEPDASPVTPNLAKAGGTRHLPSPEDLERHSPEEIRQVLNEAAAEILLGNDPEKYRRYEQLCERYDTCVYKAWYVRTVAPHNVFAGYIITEEIAEGGFGTVFRGEDPAKKQVAIKILHEKVRRKHEMLQSFRRGVASMNILSKASVAGVVPYLRALEVPVTVVMDFIEGPSLAEAVRSRLIEEWADILQIGIDLARILKTSHGLPQRVLHRDMRPTNVMIRNGYIPDRSEWEVVVLDFDLSWHKDALEQSVSPGKFSSGYLAPEQIQRDPKVSTRSALVDSFGLGMTLFFLRTGLDPLPYQHRHAEWRDTLIQRSADRSFRTWKSLPLRYFRLIDQATQDEQHKRWDMTQILGELTNPHLALSRPLEMRSAELLAEEVAARGFDQPYRWDMDKTAAILDLPTGLSATCAASERDRSISAELSWKKTGKQHHSRVTKWLTEVLPQVKSLLQKAKWQKVTIDRGQYEITVRASMSTERVVSQIDAAAKGLGKSLEALRFD